VPIIFLHDYEITKKNKINCITLPITKVIGHKLHQLPSTIDPVDAKDVLLELKKLYETYANANNNNNNQCSDRFVNETHFKVAVVSDTRFSKNERLGLSPECKKYMKVLAQNKGISDEEFDKKYSDSDKIARHDPVLIAAVEKLGYSASCFTDIRLVKVPIIFLNDYEINVMYDCEHVDLKITKVICRRLMQMANTIAPINAKVMLLELKHIYRTYATKLDNYILEDDDYDVREEHRFAYSDEFCATFTYRFKEHLCKKYHKISRHISSPNSWYSSTSF
jgi:hypothetical protein